MSKDGYKGLRTTTPVINIYIYIYIYIMVDMADGRPHKWLEEYWQRFTS